MLTDDRLHASVAPAHAVAWMREAVVAAEEGRLQAPARVHVEIGEGRLVFTAGALSGEWFGYRSYDTLDVDPGEQVVVLQSARSGQVTAIAIGNSLGQMRTGALGGLAVDVLAREDANTVGIIGSGRQAWTQIWAISAVRKLDRVSVFSRTANHAVAFAKRVRDELAAECEAVDSAAAAARDHGIVVLATNSRTPIIDPTWLAPGTHVTTVGPKQIGASEFGLDLVEAANVAVTDSLAQLHAYRPPNIVASSRHAEQVLSLGAVVASPSSGRRDDSQITLYLSVGLAGTDAYFLSRAAS